MMAKMIKTTMITTAAIINNDFIFFDDGHGQINRQIPCYIFLNVNGQYIDF